MLFCIDKYIKLLSKLYTNSYYIMKKYMGFVYLLYDESNDLYKIGVTRNNDNKRIKRLQTGNPTELRIIHIYECEYPFRLETMLHNKYKTRNVMNEWFVLKDKEVIEFMKECDKLNDQINMLKSNPFFAKNLK